MMLLFSLMSLDGLVLSLIMHSDPVARVRRRVQMEQERVYPWTGSVTSSQELFFRENDRWNREEDEINRLIADHKERVMIWKRQNFLEIGRARKDRERLESEMRHRIYPGVQGEYNRWVKANPGKTAKDRREFYASLFETRLREVRYHPDFKYPMDLVERVFAGKPHKSSELKERIKAHREHTERLNQMRLDMKRDVEEWRGMVRDDKRRRFGDE